MFSIPYLFPYLFQGNVELIKKTAADYNKQIDSVLVVSTLYAYNIKTGVITESADTLAVLPSGLRC